MNRTQKIAWWMVIWMGAAMITAGIALGISYVVLGFSKAWSELAFWGFGGLGGLAPLIFKKDPGPVQFDERDHLINAKAARIGFVLSCMVFIILCMGLWGYYRFFQGVKMMSIDILPILVWPPAIAVYLGHAITILVLYGKDNKAKEGGAA
jgi:hypothetical protein